MSPGELMSIILGGITAVGGVIYTIHTLLGHHLRRRDERVDELVARLSKVEDGHQGLRDDLHTRYLERDQIDQHISALREEIRAARGETRDDIRGIYERLNGISREMSRFLGALKAAGHSDD
jgi:hypothetical protein